MSAMGPRLREDDVALLALAPFTRLGDKLQKKKRGRNSGPSLTTTRITS